MKVSGARHMHAATATTRRADPATATVVVVVVGARGVVASWRWRVCVDLAPAKLPFQKTLQILDFGFLRWLFSILLLMI